MFEMKFCANFTLGTDEVAIATTKALLALLTITSLGACTPVSFARIPTPNGPASPADNPGSSDDGITRDPDQTPGPDDSIQQPPPSFKTTERFDQVDEGKVDILIVNDNSSSMDAEQQKMGLRFGSFISALGPIDYQIGMTTTDIDSPRWALSGRLMTWEGLDSTLLTRTTPNAPSIFKSTVQRKETIRCWEKPEGCPSTNEQPLAAVILALERRHKENSGFFREKADLAVVVLSDEDEMSDGPARSTKPKDVINRFKAAFGETKRLAVYGIIIKPGDTSCFNKQSKSTTVHYGRHVAELAEVTGGAVYSLCDSDYGTNLSSISQQVRRLVASFELTHEPKTGSVAVALTPAAAIGWKLEGKKIVFDTPPPTGTRIEVTYAH